MQHPHRYRFGDATRSLARWLGPRARFVRGRIDWLKFGQALVIAMIAGQTVNFAVVVAALTDSIRDPQWAASLPTIVAAIVYVGEQGRRLFQDGRDVEAAPLTEMYADGQSEEVRHQAGDGRQEEVRPRPE
jgi:hypothetical protein